MPAIQTVLGEARDLLCSIMAGFDYQAHVRATVARTNDSMTNNKPGVWLGQEDWERQEKQGGAALLGHLLESQDLFTVTVVF